MKGLVTGLVVLIAAMAAGLAGPVAQAAEPPGELSREAIERIVREYLLEHPEVIMEALQALEERQRTAQRQRASESLNARRSELVGDPATPVGGNPQGDVTVVEFFDYRCGYCKSVAPALKQLVKEDSKVRLVYKEFPILGPESILAARAALAAGGQGKYVALHDALMTASESLTLPVILTIAGQVGLDTARLQKDMESPAILAVIQRNHELAQALGINGTPAFVVGSELVPGAVDLAALKRLVDQARAR